MQLSKNTEIFWGTFFEVLECTLNFEDFEKKVSLSAEVFLKFVAPKDVLT